MSIHMRPQLLFLRPQSLQLALGAVSAAKKLQRCSKTLGLRVPARSLLYRPHNIVAGVALSTSVSLLLHESALCQGTITLAAAEGPTGNGDPNKKNDDSVEKIINVVLGSCGEVTMAGSLGFCSGYALKQAGKAAAMAVGLIFVLAQTAAYNGYVDIKWGKVQKDMIAKVDPNGDGKFDSQDVKLWYRKLLKIIKANLPSSTGFTSGFALGIYCS
ncbi:unnamed protein product [Peronospora destructor]|uniref:EF-hand domain-containing protein n=1 Tax=Peronospora destructor TaxID=86335 RepID=A0AAV0UDP5_9STRA|nr:unnamed protein product [Peronospora destructor]